jgi:hypothetical protein
MYILKTPMTRKEIATAPTVEHAKQYVLGLYPQSTVRFDLGPDGCGWAYAHRQRIVKIEKAHPGLGKGSPASIMLRGF